MHKIKTEWDLSPLLNGDDDPRIPSIMKEIETANMEFIKKWKPRDDYLKNPAILKQALDEYNILEGRYGQEGSIVPYFFFEKQNRQAQPKD